MLFGNHCVSPTSSDLTIIPFLSAIYASPNNSGIDPPEILNINDNNTFHTNFKISSNSETIIKTLIKQRNCDRPNDSFSGTTLKYLYWYF